MVWNSPEFKVGVLVVLVSALIGTMSLKIAEGPGVLGLSKKYWFDLPDAGGLVKNSAVKMAGIKVGIIEDIELADGRARVRISVDREVPLTRSGRVEIRTDGILGDKHVELVAGRTGDPPLDPDSQILSVKDAGSLDQIVNEVGKITESLGALADTLNKATLGEGDRSTPLGRIISNIENLTQDLADISGRNKEKVNDIIDRVQSIATNVDQFIGDEGSEGFKAAWQKAIDSLSRIDTSLKNLEEITEKINNGEGTLGRLINDESTIDGVNEAIDNVNDLLGNASSMETSIDFHSEYLADVALTKSYLSVKIQPGIDRYYELGIIDDPRGVVNTTETEVTSGGSTTTTEEVKTYKNRVKFTALFAKNFYDFTVKGGIIENSGGLGFDYYLFRKNLRLSLEAFDFRDPYLRVFAKYSFFKGIYLIGGADNILESNNDTFSTFIGGGIFITNDDLKVLASKVSF